MMAQAEQTGLLAVTATMVEACEVAEAAPEKHL